MATISILAPAGGATVVQPVTSSGTVSPGTSVVSASCKASDGHTYHAVPDTEFGPTWSFFFPEVPPGPATITVSLSNGEGPQRVKITVIGPP